MFPRSPPGCRWCPRRLAGWGSPRGLADWVTGSLEAEVEAEAEAEAGAASEAFAPCRRAAPSERTRPSRVSGGCRRDEAWGAGL